MTIKEQLEEKKAALVELEPQIKAQDEESQVTLQAVACSLSKKGKGGTRKCRVFLSAGGKLAYRR